VIIVTLLKRRKDLYLYRHISNRTEQGRFARVASLISRNGSSYLP
jgi:hypothetical protein